MSQAILAPERLLRALREDDVAEVKSVFAEENHDINQLFKFEVWNAVFSMFNYYQETLLDYVWKNGSDEMVDLVLEMGADASKISLYHISRERFLKYLPKLDKNGFDIIARISDTDPYEDDFKLQLDDHLVKVISEKNVDVNTVLSNRSSLLSFVLYRGMSNTVKCLLEKGARADGINVNSYNNKNILDHISDFIKAGFNLEENFYQLKDSISDDKLSELIEQNLIKPEFKYTETSYWRNETEEKSLINFVINGQKKQALQAMAKKGFKFDNNYAIEYSIMHEQNLFYKDNIMVLAEMGLNFANPSNYRLIRDLKEDVLVELVSRSLLDVNIPTSLPEPTFLGFALQNGYAKLVKILLEKGADASAVIMPHYVGQVEGALEKAFLDNLDNLIKNGLKLSELNLGFILKSNQATKELIASFIDKGLINPTDVINSVVGNMGIRDKFLSKEFISLLLEKGLNLNDKIKYHLKVSEALHRYFELDAVVSLFKDGTLKATPELVFGGIEKGVRPELVVELLKANIIAPDCVFNGIPLLNAYHDQGLVRDYLISNGAFGSLNQLQREDFILRIVENRTYHFPDHQKLELLQTLNSKHSYKLGEYEFCVILKSRAPELVKYALGGGIDLNKPLSADLRDVDGKKVGGLIPIQAAAILDDQISLLDVLIANGADINVLTKEGYSLATLKLISGTGSFASCQYLYEKGIKPQGLDALLLASSYSVTGVRMYFGQIDFNQLITLPNKESYPRFYKANSAFKDVESTTFAHYLAHHSLSALKELITQNGIDLNIKDSAGKTPIFYAKDKEIAEYLIANGAKTDVVDNNGNTLLHNTSDIELLKIFKLHNVDTTLVNSQGQKWYDGKPLVQLIENELLTEWKSIPKLTNFLLQRGEVLKADSFYKQGANIAFDLRHDLVESLKLGISSSLEVNKYQALIGMFNKYAIQLPSFLYKYLNDPQDYESTKELEMILSDQFLNQLVDQYLAMNGVETTAINEYTAYTTTMDKVIKKIEEDLAIEVLAINKLTLVPLQEEHFVYRGLKLPDIVEFINHNFLHGHKALLKSGVHNFGFHADEPWSKTLHTSYAWEFAGNYASFSKNMAMQFATSAATSTLNSGGVLMQIKVGPETKFVCGRNSYESEIITLSTIPVESIKSITIVGTGEVVVNPNYIASALDNLESLTEDQRVENYRAMGCEQYIISNRDKVNLGELSNYDKFIETFTPTELAEHRKKVYLAAEQTEMCFMD